MSLYRKVFPREHSLLVVVHAENTTQAIGNVAIASENGADGAFLVNHHIPAADLTHCYEEARKLFPDFWIGVNWLDLQNHEAIRSMQPGMNGLWVDNLGINEDAETPEQVALYDQNFREQWERDRAEKFLYFGSIAFKGQPTVKNLSRVARQAKQFADVITTSGSRTGVGPDIMKMFELRRAVGPLQPLAIASGVNIDNVHGYMEYANCFLVSTGVSKSFSWLDPFRVRQLAGRIRDGL